MRHIFLLPVLLVGLVACSPTTDQSRNSTEGFAGRSSYRVLKTDEEAGLLRVRLKVGSMSAARTIAEDVAIQKWHAFDRIQVDVIGPNDQENGAPSAVLHWSTKNGFNYSENR